MSLFGGMIGSWGTSVRCKSVGTEPIYGDGICYFESHDKIWAVVAWDKSKYPDIVLASKVMIKRLGERSFRKGVFI